MPPRLHVSAPLRGQTELDLPDGAARHVQVLRLQPGAALTLFDGHGGEWAAEVLAMGRRDVRVRLGAHSATERELACRVELAFAMPANERMDALVEKATELGVARLQPLVSERSVLRLSGERAERKQAHWQGIAVAACEQCGRNRVPEVAAVQTLAAWLKALQGDAERWMLSPAASGPWALPAGGSVVLLSGPEGGLSPDEEAAALARGFVPRSLGPRVLRADTAPVAALAAIALSS